jgi:hypothetical protein
MVPRIEAVIGHLRKHQRAYLLPIWLLIAGLLIAGAISWAIATPVVLVLSCIQVVLSEGKRHAPR